jgi:hypothetical protein
LSVNVSVVVGPAAGRSQRQSHHGRNRALEVADLVAELSASGLVVVREGLVPLSTWSGESSDLGMASGASK